jgi:hypothetical protein
MERWLVFTYCRGTLFKVAVCRSRRGATRSANQVKDWPDWTTKTVQLSHVEALLLGVDFEQPTHRRMLKTVQ